MSTMNTTSTTGLHVTLQNYYDGKLLMEMEKRLVFYQNGQRKALPKHSGRAVEFWRYKPFDAVTTALTEGVIPNSQTLSMEKVVCNVASYGAISATHKLTIADIRKAVRTLEKNGAPKFNRGGKGYYKAIVGSDAKYSLQSDSLWEEKGKYQQAE